MRHAETYSAESPTIAHSEAFEQSSTTNVSGRGKEIDSGASDEGLGTSTRLQDVYNYDLPWIDNGDGIFTLPDFGKFEIVVMNCNADTILGILDSSEGRCVVAKIGSPEGLEILAYLEGCAHGRGVRHKQGSDGACRVALESFFGPGCDDTKGCFEALLGNLIQHDLASLLSALER